MSFDAPLLPPSMMTDCDAGLSGPPQAQDAIRGLLGLGLGGYRESREGVECLPSSVVEIDTGPGRIGGFSKRTCDYAIAITSLFFLWPIMLVIAVLICLDSTGPVLFRQRRLGLGGKQFWVWKYRTMVVDAEERLKEIEHLNESDGGVLFKIKRDPRVTRVGQFLRRSSLDELPQLFNILRGEMSVVGPRPLQLRDSAYLQGLAPRQFARRLAVLPGLTGPWQVSGRSEIGFERMLELDLEYIDHGTILTDLRILWKTLKVVLMGKGAC